MTAQMII